MASLSINTRNHVRSTSGEMLNMPPQHYQIPRGANSMSNLRDNAFHPPPNRPMNGGHDLHHRGPRP
ncbi:hypothetical protein BGX24_009908, partial [Mortierella sp. AD032]